MENYTNNAVINLIVETIEPHLSSIVEKTKQKFLSDGHSFTDYDEQNTRLNILSNLIKNLSNYISINDKLDRVEKSRLENDGSITVEFWVIRDGERHFVETDVILVGGYNIVSLHYRYIIKTKLKKIYGDTQNDKIKEKISNLKKADRLQKDRITYINSIKREEENNKRLSSLTDKDIRREYFNKFSASSNMEDGTHWENNKTVPQFLETFPTKQTYLDWNENNIKRDIESNKQAIIHSGRRIIELQKEVQKIDNKIKAIL